MLGIFIYVNIKQIIQEEINDFDWVSNMVSIDIGTCIEFPWGTKGESKHYTITSMDSQVVQLSSNNTDDKQMWGRKKVLEKLGDGTMLLCNKGINESNDFDWTEDIQAVTPIGELVDGDTVKLRIPDTDLLDRVLYDCEEKWTSEDFTNIKFTIDGIDPTIVRRDVICGCQELYSEEFCYEKIHSVRVFSPFMRVMKPITFWLSEDLVKFIKVD